ncbi:hypothetical protein SE16_00750 [Ardenticatena maritima]|uniref:Uncharacterized protein n=1 Tax=Ardenticatena maritima TaxID=872965 RepID=A0A0P6YHW8_9CHLR|nr:hypothetical protein SE16_00750 [Ardenticatena maritima]
MRKKKYVFGKRNEAINVTFIVFVLWLQETNAGNKIPLALLVLALSLFTRLPIIQSLSLQGDTGKSARIIPKRNVLWHVVDAPHAKKDIYQELASSCHGHMKKDLIYGVPYVLNLSPQMDHSDFAKS